MPFVRSPMMGALQQMFAAPNYGVPAYSRMPSRAVAQAAPPLLTPPVPSWPLGGAAGSMRGIDPQFPFTVPTLPGVSASPYPGRAPYGVGDTMGPLAQLPGAPPPWPPAPLDAVARFPPGAPINGILR